MKCDSIVNGESLSQSEERIFTGWKMEACGSKNAKQSKMAKSVYRSWTARPILSSEFTEDPPLHEVFVGTVKRKKDISNAIPSISSAVPGFHHLKRCSSDKLLLAPVEYSSGENRTTILSEEELKEILKNKNFDLSVLEDTFEVRSLPVRAPKTKAQAMRISKIWPVNFHPDPNVESLISGSIFDEPQLDLIDNYMRVAIEAAKLEAIGNADCNGSAVVVDPADGRILAIAASRIDLHPMWHASMLAVDLVARLQGGGAWDLDEDSSAPREQVFPDQNTNFQSRQEHIKRKYEEEAPLYYPKSLSKIPLPVQSSFKSAKVSKNRKSNDSTKRIESEAPELSRDLESCGPYLCTGYWVFLLKEPCPLCAMALLHSRVLRIFYGIANQRTGVLGSKTVLHAIPGLNHRYQVWSGIREEDCQEAMKQIEERLSTDPTT